MKLTAAEWKLLEQGVEADYVKVLPAQYVAADNLQRLGLFELAFTSDGSKHYWLTQGGRNALATRETDTAE